MLSDEIKIWIDVEETMNWKQSSSSSFLFLECDLSVCRKRWIKQKKTKKKTRIESNRSTIIRCVVVALIFFMDVLNCKKILK